MKKADYAMAAGWLASAWLIWHPLIDIEIDAVDAALLGAMIFAAVPRSIT